MQLPPSEEPQELATVQTLGLPIHTLLAVVPAVTLVQISSALLSTVG